MASRDRFKFDIWLKKALQSVIKQSLNETLISGLSNNHHFYINFNTNHRSVILEPFLLEQYPNNMTISYST